MPGRAGRQRTVERETDADSTATRTISPLLPGYSWGVWGFPTVLGSDLMFACRNQFAGYNVVLIMIYWFLGLMGRMPIQEAAGLLKFYLNIR